MITFVLENLPRLAYMGFSLYALIVLFTRWHVSRVMTQDRRFLLLFFFMEASVTTLSGALKIHAGAAVDMSAYLTVLTQSFLAAYLHYSIPSSFKRAHYRLTRRR